MMSMDITSSRGEHDTGVRILACGALVPGSNPGWGKLARIFHLGKICLKFINFSLKFH